MNISYPIENQKLARIWSDRRERLVAVRIHYSTLEQGGCKLFQLSEVEDLE